MLRLLLLLLLLNPSSQDVPAPVVRDAIRHVAPSRRVGPRTAMRYARLIVRQSRRRQVPALLAVAFFHTESRWDPKLRSPTNDYGLGQVHVAPRGSARFLGREHELYVPSTNIREWFRLAAMWRDYHNEREPASKRAGHKWWAHMKWGYNVKGDGSGRAGALFLELVERFGVQRPTVAMR